ncbi:MAG: hypothetical protein ACTHJR_15125 [Sphingomonas sp.]|uniref:hypothetical protein n=1 Tax=Sphingomonas sp. TaxID=28214 RepID=UPI003F80914E
MKMLALSVAASAVVAGPIAGAQTVQFVEHPVIAALIADLDAGRADKALAKIDVIESASGRPKLVATPAEFVSRMKGCRIAKVKAGPYFSGDPYQTTNTAWNCPDGPALVMFAAHPGATSVTIGEYTDAARIKSDATRPIPVKP